MIKYLVFDTEGTGLNIMTDNPFLFQYGLVDENLNLVSQHHFRVENLAEMATFKKHIDSVETLVGHNIKFDLHMSLNAGIPASKLQDKNFIDTTWLARLAINHDQQSDGSFSLSLTKLASRYLGIDASDEERALKAELSHLTSQHKHAMMEHLKAEGIFPETKTSREDTKIINRIYNQWNKLFHTFTPELAKERKAWLKDNPAPNYSDISNILTYGDKDVTLTHGLFKLWYPKIVQLKQVDTFMRLNKATWALLLMERKGLVVDVAKLMKDREEAVKAAAAIKLVDPETGEKLTIGQHKRLRQVYEYETGLMLDSANRETRLEIMKDSPTARKAEELSKINKYLTTYITGILNKLVKVDGEYKVFTQYNMAGTITGRLSSNFQQFPRAPLVLENGHEINIRGWFKVPRDDKYMVYFDYSQLELRIQCEWTAIVNDEPDINMARAYMPYKTIEKNGKHYLEEDPDTEWEPVDLHAMTAKEAFPDIDESHPDWKDYRTLGKRTNFAVNYGASAPRLVQALKVDMPTARALINGYRNTFKGVVDFGKWIQSTTYSSEFIPNLFLRRYYSRNKHQLNNWLVQGTGADLLLIKLREIQEYIADKPHWEFLITVHDEVGLTCKDIPKDQLDKEIREIQDLMGYKFSAVDVISDVEITETYWSEKKDY